MIAPGLRARFTCFVIERMRSLNLSSSSRGSSDLPHRLPVIPGWLFLILVLAWLLPGLIGHEPWKPDEAYTFGLIEHIAKTGDWVVPTLAGEPFMEKPPIFFISAAWVLQGFGGAFSAPDAARLTAGFWMLLAMLGTALAAWRIYGKGTGRWAVLLLLGCLGLPLRAHQMLTDLALLAGIAWGICGLTWAPVRPLAGGVMLGLGGMVAFLAKGLLGPGCLGLTAILLPVFLPSYRSGRYALAFVIALVVGSPLPVLWMNQLYARDPGLFQLWFNTNNFGRFNGTAHLGPAATHFFYLKTLPWYAFPAWPLAVWGLWRAWRGQIQLSLTAIAPALLFFAINSLVLVLAADARELYAMPLLAPTVLIAVSGLVMYREGSPGWARLSTLVMVLAALLLTCAVVSGYALATGTPQAVEALLTRRVFAGWTPAWFPGHWLACGVIVILVLLLWPRVPRNTPAGFAWRWMLLITLTWGAIATLWLPALDFGMRYREVFVALKPALDKPAAQNECIASAWLGEPQRALLDYYDGVRTRRLETMQEARSCRWLLVQSRGGQLPVLVNGMQPVAVSHRPGDNTERYMLYQLQQDVHALWPASDPFPGAIRAAH
ncbi:ArnT family glycosyltransferase [Silvimonas amylolytica]|uniref:ArnT family glycosyltransferase n=1 Tax=Silvimonas amylolytica TaxID=449663 RepID=UPI001665CDB5|nr:UDP phosphate-alpha-4-amino-4-deoxy-L- arabinose arabinosyl transferase [Silvimonas amylolytica]